MTHRIVGFSSILWGQVPRATSYASGGNEFLVRVLIGNWSIKIVLRILTHTHTRRAASLACIRMQRGANINKIFISFMHLLLPTLCAASTSATTTTEKMKYNNCDCDCDCNQQSSRRHFLHNDIDTLRPGPLAGSACSAWRGRPLRRGVAYFMGLLLDAYKDDVNTA